MASSVNSESSVNVTYQSPDSKLSRMSRLRRSARCLALIFACFCEVPSPVRGLRLSRILLFSGIILWVWYLSSTMYLRWWATHLLLTYAISVLLFYLFLYSVSLCGYVSVH